MSKMKEIRQGVFGNADVRQYGMVFSLVAIITLFYFTTDGVVLSSVNLINVVAQYSYILILAIGMVMVIIAGHIDLSVGSVVALTGAVSAVLVVKNGMPWWVGVIAAIVVGILVGAWHGFWVAFVGIPATMPTMMPRGHAIPQSAMVLATTMPTNAATEPTDRSMCPAMITITMPIARTRM